MPSGISIALNSIPILTLWKVRCAAALQACPPEPFYQLSLGLDREAEGRRDLTRSLATFNHDDNLFSTVDSQLSIPIRVVHPSWALARF